ncbi:hypothetical protein BDD43_4171 [Mucilaginibacter gracilis]|uniref:Uncharacterized protein n=1 Tax=Mucilaginibacter gracilis TaxID=423350 RepID=A0A495J4P3_9SPHI|nr:hypothetical protein BDD43_4171 [Mucilaginibacter gracilis]
MTIPAVIGINFFLIVIIIPIIGIIGGLILYSKTKNIGEASINPYKGTLQNSRDENIKRWN